MRGDVKSCLASVCVCVCVGLRRDTDNYHASLAQQDSGQNESIFRAAS